MLGPVHPGLADQSCVCCVIIQFMLVAGSFSARLVLVFAKSSCQYLGGTVSDWEFGYIKRHYHAPVEGATYSLWVMPARGKHVETYLTGVFYRESRAAKAPEEAAAKVAEAEKRASIVADAINKMLPTTTI